MSVSGGEDRSVQLWSAGSDEECGESLPTDEQAGPSPLHAPLRELLKILFKSRLHAPLRERLKFLFKSLLHAPLRELLKILFKSLLHAPLRELLTSAKCTVCSWILTDIFPLIEMCLPLIGLVVSDDQAGSVSCVLLCKG